MNKLKFVIVFAIAFTMGEAAMQQRMKRSYEPIINNLKTKKNALLADLEVQTLKMEAWRDAARALDHGHSYEEVRAKFDDKMKFARVIRDSI